jgi:hypothetical protein
MALLGLTVCASISSAERESVMAITTSLRAGIKTVCHPDFWSFRVVHAVLGSILTLAGAAGSLLIGDGLRKHIGEVNDRIAAAEARVETIRNTLAQFRIVQSNGVILGALSAGSGLRQEYQQSFTELMFVLRRGPALSVLGELHLDDVEAFRQARDEFDRLVASAVAPERTREDWDKVLEFEMTHERRLMDLLDDYRANSFRLKAEKRELEQSLDTATLVGFSVQQLGFVVILLAGLVYEHGARKSSADLARGP